MGDIGMIKGGACLVAQTRRRVVVDVVDHRGISSGLEVYRRRRGGRNSKYKAHRCNTKHDKTISNARGVLTQGYTIPAKGETSGDVFSKFGIFGQMKRRGTAACSLC
mgnify:CR=1 FL=1